jgi:hypothetical protein
VTWQPQVSFVATENEWWRFCLSCLKLGFRLAIASQVQNFTILILSLGVLFLFIFASYFSLKISKLEFWFSRCPSIVELCNFILVSCWSSFFHFCTLFLPQDFKIRIYVSHRHLSAKFCNLALVSYWFPFFQFCTLFLLQDFIK